VPVAETPATEATSSSVEPDPVAPPPAKIFRRLASDSQKGLARAAANNEAPAVLSGLDNELERHIAEISAPSDVECGLTFTFSQDRHRQMS